MQKIGKTKQQLNLGADPIKPTIIKLALPMMVAQIVNLLYSMVDKIYIGNIQSEAIPNLGSLAFGGMTIAQPIIVIVAAFAAFVGMGSAPLVGIKMGEKDDDGAEKIMSNAFFVLTIFGILLTIVIMNFRDDLLWMFGAVESNFKYADEYLSIYMIGTIFVMYSLGLNVFINAQGFATRAMMSVVIGAVINIILDPIFIFGFGLVTRGAALATIIAQLCSAIFILFFLTGKKTKIRLNLKKFRPNFKVIGTFLALGIAPFIMQSTEAMVQIFFNVQITKFGGELVSPLITVIGISITTMQILIIPVMSFAQGAAPFLSYNYGMGNVGRIKKGVKFICSITFVVAFVISLLVIFFPAIFVRIFNQDPIVIELGKKYMPVFFSGLTLMGLQCGFQNSFLAFGKAKISLFLAMLRKIILLIPILLILPNFIGVDGIFLSECIADFIAMITTIITFALLFGKIMTGREKELSQKLHHEQ